MGRPVYGTYVLNVNGISVTVVRTQVKRINTRPLLFGEPRQRGAAVQQAMPHRPTVGGHEPAQLSQSQLIRKAGNVAWQRSQIHAPSVVHVFAERIVPNEAIGTVCAGFSKTQC